MSERLEKIEPELAALEERRAELERIIAARDEAALDVFDGGESAGKSGARGKSGAGDEDSAAHEGVEARLGREGTRAPTLPLVGRLRDRRRPRRARQRPADLPRRALATTPGCTPPTTPARTSSSATRGRDETIPHRTLVEAARLAAHFSQARKDSKVAVNYTQRKFVSKPNGAAPGLVYLSTFRTLLVEPARRA